MKSFFWCLHLLLLMILCSCGLVPKSKEEKAAEVNYLNERQRSKEAMAQRILDRILLPLVILALMVSCTQKPKFKPVPVKMPNGETKVVMAPDLGGSLMAKKSLEFVDLKDPFTGMRVTYLAMDNDETVVPVKVVDAVTTQVITKEATKMFLGTPGVYKGESLLKGTKDPNFIPKDPNLPTTQIVPEGTMVAPR